MTKDEIAKKAASITGLGKHKVTAVIDAFIAAVEDAVANGENVTLRGFGTIKRVDRLERKGRDLHASKEVVIPARRSVKFKACREFNAKLNKG